MEAVDGSLIARDLWVNLRSPAKSLFEDLNAKCSEFGKFMTGQTNPPHRLQSVPPGTQLNNMFEIERLLASGGMGEVYQGRNIETHDPVAIKLVLPEFAQDEMILELFRKEARILNHLYDEAIVRYYVFSVDKALERPFLAMEYVDGYALSERIKSGPIDIGSVVTLKARLAKGLQQAHEAGVIHRDIAPDNVILPEGRVDKAKIIDFGIARSAMVGGGTVLGGNFAGKYNFVSPEQLGLFGGQVTYLSDIYSLGLVLAACLRGAPLDMAGTQLQVVEKRRVVPDLSSIEPSLRDLLEAMLQPDPDDRPQSMAEVAAWPISGYGPPDAQSSQAGSWHPTYPPTRPPTHRPGQATSPQATSPHATSPHATSSHVTSPHATLPGAASRAPQRKPGVLARRPAAVMLASGVLIVLLGGLGGLYYVENWSGRWYEAVLPPQEAVDGRSAERQDESQPIEQARRPEPEPEATPIEAATPAPIEEGVSRPARRDDAATVEEVRAPVPDASATPDPAGPRTLPLTPGAVATFLREYPGGECFFATAGAVQDHRVLVVGYGGEAPFRRLLADFKTSFGIEPDIHLQPVSDAQCVVVDAVAKLSGASDHPPILELDRDIVRSGQSLSGSVSRFGDYFVEILVIDNQGLVQRLGYEDANSRMTFNAQLDGTLSRPEPQLVLSVASSMPLVTLNKPWPRGYVPAEQLVPELLEEIERNRADVAAAVKFFTFGG